MSNSEFERQKSMFFYTLKKDGGIGGTEAEIEIRALFDDMLRYATIANSALYVGQIKQEKEDARAGSAEENTTETTVSDENACKVIKRSQRLKPIVLSIDDVTHIASTVGRAPKKERPHVLNADIALHQTILQKVIKEKRFDPVLFPKETGETLRALEDDTLTDEGTEHAINGLFTTASDFMNRSLALRKLVRSEDSITNYEAENAKHTIKQIFHGDWTHFYAMWNSEDLLYRRRKELAVYFSQQAEINEIKFKTLMIFLSMISGDSDPVKKVEYIYQTIMETFNEYGGIEVNLTLHQKDPSGTGTQ